MDYTSLVAWCVEQHILLKLAASVLLVPLVTRVVYPRDRHVISRLDKLVLVLRLIAAYIMLFLLLAFWIFAWL